MDAVFGVFFAQLTEAFLTSFNLALTGVVGRVSAWHESFKNSPCAVVAWLPSTSKLMAGEGGSRTHLSTCMDKPVLKTGRATGPYPPPFFLLLNLVPVHYIHGGFG